MLKVLQDVRIEGLPSFLKGKILPSFVDLLYKIPDSILEMLLPVVPAGIIPDDWNGELHFAKLAIPAMDIDYKEVRM